MINEKEIWRNVPIEGYERYLVSNYGRVMNGDTGRILKGVVKENGYLKVVLYNNYKYKTLYIHRLVGLAFIENDDPINKTQINHKDEDKTNNHVSNLVFVTPKENSNYGTRNERISKARRGNNYGKLGGNHHNAKKVVQLTLDGELLKVWDSTTEAERSGEFTNSGISKCCNGKLKTHKNFQWMYYEDYLANSKQEETIH